MKRAAMNDETFRWRKPQPTAEITYSTPIHSSVALRPKRSVGQPPSSEPSTVP